MGQAELDAESQSFRVPSAHGYGTPESDVNRLAHIFMDDRTIGGKRTLLVKEAQSDWHAKGRHEGYTHDLNSLPEAAEIRKLGITYPLDRVSAHAIEEAGGSLDLADRWSAIVKRAGGAPDAPFKTTWQELVMKRMIRYAAENGYEKLALGHWRRAGGTLRYRQASPIRPFG